MNNYSQMPLSAVEPQFKAWGRQLVTHQTTNLFFLKNTGLLPRVFQFRDYFNSRNKAKVQIIDLDAENLTTSLDLANRLQKLKSQHTIILARDRFLHPDSIRLEPVIEHYHTSSPFQLILVHECAPHELYVTWSRSSILYVCPTLFQLPTNLEDIFIYTNSVIKLWDMQLTQQQVQDCVNYCGNSPWLINEYIRLQSEYPNYDSMQIIQLPSLKYRVKETYDSLPTRHKEFLSGSNLDPQIGKELHDSGILNSHGDPFGQNLKDSIQQSRSNSIQISDGHIYSNQVDLSNFFTPGEINLLASLINSPQPLARDAVANSLYQSNNPDYSDWALSQSISRLRTKLDRHHIPLQILPVRGVGYVAKRD